MFFSVVIVVLEFECYRSLVGVCIREDFSCMFYFIYSCNLFSNVQIYSYECIYSRNCDKFFFFFESNCDKYFQPDDYIFCIIYAALVRDVFPDIG